MYIIVLCTLIQKKKTTILLFLKNSCQLVKSVKSIDDFLASGEAAMGLAKLVEDAGDEVVGMAIAIEKSFQPGRERLEHAGYRVESLVRIKEFKDNGCVFIED